MKKILSAITALCLIAMLNSCAQEPMDPAIVQHKVDSLASIKIDEARAKAIIDCETRMATEVKFKTDSMVNAAIKANTPI